MPQSFPSRIMTLTYAQPAVRARVAIRVETKGVRLLMFVMGQIMGAGGLGLGGGQASDSQILKRRTSTEPRSHTTRARRPARLSVWRDSDTVDIYPHYHPPESYVDMITYGRVNSDNRSRPITELERRDILTVCLKQYYILLYENEQWYNSRLEI